jgi:hypothetical protein
MYEQYYKILECSPNDDIKHIRKQYLKLALKYHPDKNKEHGDFFREINEAYQAISSSMNEPVTSHLESPIDLLREILSHYDNDLADIIYDTLSLLTPNSKNIHDLLRQIINIPKYDLIKTGTTLVKQYLERKCNITNHNIYKLYINDEELKDEYNIECSLDFLTKYSSIDLLVNNQLINTFDLQYQNVSIKYNNNIHEFYFIDKFLKGFKRINKYDLLLEINDIPIKNINNIISINHPFINDSNLLLSINIKSTSSIYLFNNIGIWNPTINNYGNIYVILSFIDNIYYNEYVTITTDYINRQPDNILSIYDIFSE